MSILAATCCCDTDRTTTVCEPPTLGVCCFDRVVTDPPPPCNGLCVGYDITDTYLGEISGITETQCSAYVGSFDVARVVWTVDPLCTPTPITEWRCESFKNVDHCFCDQIGGYFISGATDESACGLGWCCHRWGTHPTQTAQCAGPMLKCQCEKSTATSHVFSYDTSSCLACVNDPPPPPERLIMIWETVSGGGSIPIQERCYTWGNYFGTTWNYYGGLYCRYGMNSRCFYFAEYDPNHDDWVTVIANYQAMVDSENADSLAAYQRGDNYEYRTTTLHYAKFYKDPTGNETGYPQATGSYFWNSIDDGYYVIYGTWEQIPCGPCCKCYGHEDCSYSSNWCIGSGCPPSLISNNNNVNMNNTKNNLEKTISEPSDTYNKNKKPNDSILQLASKYVGAEINQIIHGETEAGVAEKRLAECMKCSHRQVTYKNIADPNGIGFCDACGCGSNARAQLGVKVTISAATCPLNKWDKSEGVGFSLNTALQSAQGLVKTAAEMLKIRTNKNGY